MTYESEQARVCRELGVNTIVEARRYYLSLDRQERSNLLYHLGIGGGVLGLAPSEYPGIAPVLRWCDCGGYSKVAEVYDNRTQGFIYRRYCPVCGAGTGWYPSLWQANKAWDNRELTIQTKVKQLSLFER